MDKLVLCVRELFLEHIKNRYEDQMEPNRIQSLKGKEIPRTAALKRIGQRTVQLRGL